MKKDPFGKEKPKITAYIIAVLLGAAITFIFMLAFAAITVSADLSDSFIAPFASLSAATGGLASGFIASKILKSGGLLNGAVTGGILFLIVLIISLFADRGGLSLNTLFNFLIIMLSALLGGIWGISRKKKII